MGRFIAAGREIINYSNRPNQMSIRIFVPWLLKYEIRYECTIPTSIGKNQPIYTILPRPLHAPVLWRISTIGSHNHGPGIIRKRSNLLTMRLMDYPFQRLLGIMPRHQQLQ